MDPGGWSHEVLKTLWANPIARVPLQDWLDKLMYQPAAYSPTRDAIQDTIGRRGEADPDLYPMEEDCNCGSDSLHQADGGAQAARETVWHSCERRRRQSPRLPHESSAPTPGPLVLAVGLLQCFLHLVAGKGVRGHIRPAGR